MLTITAGSSFGLYIANQGPFYLIQPDNSYCSGRFGKCPVIQFNIFTIFAYKSRTLIISRQTEGDMLQFQALYMPGPNAVSGYCWTECFYFRIFIYGFRHYLAGMFYCA